MTFATQMKTTLAGKRDRQGRKFLVTRSEAFMSRVKTLLEAKRARRRDRKRRQLFKHLLLMERIRSDKTRDRLQRRPSVQKVSNQQRRKNERQENRQEERTTPVQ